MSKHTAEAKARAWTPERRAAQAERMRLRNSEPTTRDLRIAALKASPKANLARRLNALGRKMSPSCRAKVAAHLRKITHDPIILAKVAEARKHGPIPRSKKGRYRQLRDLIGVKAAMAIVKREAAIAAKAARGFANAT